MLSAQERKRQDEAYARLAGRRSTPEDRTGRGRRADPLQPVVDLLAIGEQQDLIARGEAKHCGDLPRLIRGEREILPDDEAVGHRSTSETQSSR